MKKLLLLVMSGFLLVASQALTSTCSVSRYMHKGSDSLYILKATCTADGTGAFDDLTISGYAGHVEYVRPDPGATVPTTLMDITLELGSTGGDLLGGAGANIDTSTDDVYITPALGSAAAPAAFTGPIILKQSGNSVVSATIDYYIAIQP